MKEYPETPVDGKCKLHRQYKAIRKPQVPCKACQTIYDEKQGQKAA